MRIEKTEGDAREEREGCLIIFIFSSDGGEEGGRKAVALHQFRQTQKERGGKTDLATTQNHNSFYVKTFNIIC